jgi:hypothetical protein
MNKTYILSEKISLENFYPTPKGLIDKMLSDIDINKHISILEPSSGTGNIVKELSRLYNKKKYRNNGNTIEIDCIEIDKNLQQIFKYNCIERYNDIIDRIHEIEQTKVYNNDTKRYEYCNNSYELLQLQEEKENFIPGEIRLIHDDFLSFNTYKNYDAIIMNPPFSEGDKHLLKAIELQQNGGYIVCLLNAETIRNPYTNTRLHLLNVLKELNASVEFSQDEFLSTETERKTNVEIALIKIDIPKKNNKSFIYEELQAATEMNFESEKEINDLTVNDYIEAIINQYNFEVKGTIKLIKEYIAFKPYMLNNFNDKYSSAILTLTIGDKTNYNQTININKYLQKVRLKYWRALFENPKFTGKLTSNLQTKFREMIEELKNYDFTLFNISKIQEEIKKEMIQGVEDTILDLFDKLSLDHSWYPESKKNIHYYNGWKTNVAHKINKKVIIPIHGAFSSYSWVKKTFDSNTVYHVMADIEKVFNYLNTGDVGEVDLRKSLENADENGQTKNINLKYFNITLYKKGTCHIEFKNQELIDKLNIFGSQKKNWLPPNYGKVSYEDMTNEEQTIINDFQGKQEYNKVFLNPNQYLYSVNNIKFLE